MHRLASFPRALVALGLVLLLPFAFADPAPTYSLVIHDHAFAPATLTVPAGKRIALRVKNARSLPAEFESFELNREKIIPGGATVMVWIGPLAPGKYKFFDDFNPDVTGQIVAEKQPGDKS